MRPDPQMAAATKKLAVPPDTVFVAVSADALAQLAGKESEPLAILRIVPIPDSEAYEMVVRRPSRAELEDAIRERFTHAPSVESRSKPSWLEGKV